MKWIIVSLAWLLLSVPGILFADDELKTVVAALETPFRDSTAADRQIRDFSAAFVQISTVISIDRSQRGEGDVWFKFQTRTSLMPKFRWDYQLPNEQQVISDGSALWVYIPENRQVVISDVREVESEYGDNPAAFFMGLGDLARNFDIDWAAPHRDEDGHYRLLLTPRRPSQFFQQIEAVVNYQAVSDHQQRRALAHFPLVATKVTDPQGNLTQINFDNVRWNLDLDDSIFVFEVPSGVEQISPATHMSF